MKASKLITFLQTAIKKHDYEIYFDTEAAVFDSHMVQISEAVIIDGDIISGEDMLILKTDNKNYNHSERKAKEEFSIKP